MIKGKVVLETVTQKHEEIINHFEVPVAGRDTLRLEGMQNAVSALLSSVRYIDVIIECYVAPGTADQRAVTAATGHHAVLAQPLV